jgi:large subunit ribosomal protein L15
VNLSDLAVFEKGAVVDANALREKRLVRGRFDGIKVLGDGELTHAVTIRAHGFSKSALEKIAKAGGKAEVIALAPRAE